MRRRLTSSLLGLVLATLVVVGLGTLALARAGARATTRDDVARQATSTAELVRITQGRAGELTPAQQRAIDAGLCDELPSPSADDRRSQARRLLCLGATQRQARRDELEQRLEQESITIVTLGPGDTISGDLPLGLAEDAVDVPAARLGTISGDTGDRVYALAPVQPGATPTEAVAITRPVSPVVSRAARWFVLSAGVTLVLAAAVAAWLARRLARPLQEATAVTERIAAGDLGARLPVPEHDRGRHDELEALAAAINTMATNLERSRGLEQQFLLSVSHDLRTPLTSIRGYAEALADGAAPDPAAAGDVILAESRRLERLVRDLLDLARLDARQFTLHPAPVDLTVLAAASVNGFRQELDVLGLTVVVDAPAAVPAWGDADRIQQVLANLLENAAKYAAATLTVRVTATAGEGVVEVIDDGPGIATEDLPHVFERLYVARAAPTRSEAGSGLGLAIVRELVDAMGGSVEATAAPGTGTRLVVRLPSSQRTVAG